MRSIVEQVALADRWGIPRTRAGRDAGGSSAGVPVTTELVADHLARRRLGYGRGARVKFEQDEVTFLGGVRHGLSLGSPMAVVVGNTEWPKWEKVMSADPVDPSELKETGRNAPLTRPRPGHADLAGMQKYGFDEARPILERASARETAARVALGAVARSFLKEAAGIEIVSHVVELAAAKAPYGVYQTPGAVEKLDADPVRCLDADASKAMVAEIDQPTRTATPSAASSRSSPTACPSGSARVHWDRRLDARLAASLMGIQGHQGRRGRRRFRPRPRARLEGPRRDRPHRGRHQAHLRRLRRHRGRSDHRRAAARPRRDRADRDRPARAGHDRRRHRRGRGRPRPGAPTCARSPHGIVAEAMVALVLADAVVEKVGGDSVPRPVATCSGTSTT
ncbi:chorismate synthase [Streptomyces tanashiensis]